jgi:hypothetical protein
MSTNEAEPRPTGSNHTSNVEAIIIALSAGAVLGLILIAQGRTTDKQLTHPMHSPNDRSRFATIRALGDNGTYAIGSIHEDGSFTDGSIVKEFGWDSIDKVRRPDNGLLYSSKPPLLPTLLAGEYMLLKMIPTFSYSPEDGWQHTGQLTFAEHPQALVRIIVATANWVPFVIYLTLFSRLLGRITSDEWVRAFAVAAAAGGTYLTGFSVTLNNHTVAAFCSFFALYPAIVIWLDDKRNSWLFAVSGFFAAFTAVMELPALALAAALFLALAWKDLEKCLMYFIPLAVIPLAAHCLANYQVTGSLMPAYGEKEWYVFEGSYWKIDDAGRLVGSSNDADGNLIIGDPTGIDNQHEPWYVYLFHMWLGHHGVFSLTPVLIFSAIGVGRTIARGDRPWVHVAYLALGLTLILIIFYTFGPAPRNYGGMCNGMRWLFWLIPLWLVFVPIGLEWKAGCRGFRFVALVLLLISAASVFYATRNPWTRPWLQELLKQANWIIY